MLTYRLYSKDGSVCVESGTADNLKALKVIMSKPKATIVKSNTTVFLWCNL